MTENKSLEQNDDIIMNEPEPDTAGPSTCPDTGLDNMAVLLYEDEIELLTYQVTVLENCYLLLVGEGVRYIISLKYII